MGIFLRHHRIGVAVVLGLVLLSCEKTPTTPTPPPAGAPAPPPGGPPSPPVTVRLEIAAPRSIAPGESVQLTARAIKADGSAEDITSQAQWSTSNSQLQVSQTGLATAVERGESTIYARYQSREGSAHVFAVPAGTFKLFGQITEVGFPVEGVSVEVTEGTGEGLAVTTSRHGTFVLYGVAGRIRLHAKKRGYFNKIEQTEVVEHTTLNFQMVPERPRTFPDLSGTYSLTLTATGCQGFPEPAPSRTYTATIEQSGSALKVRLEGADFIVTGGRGDNFQGVIDLNDRITFALGGSSSFYYYYYSYLINDPDVIERLSPSTALVISGRVEIDRVGSSIRGMLRGGFFIVNVPMLPQTPLRTSASCFSSSHGFELRRR
jgi:hypothetical protein